MNRPLRERAAVPAVPVHLGVLGSLLAAPQAGSMEALAEVSVFQPWLQPALVELESQGIEPWRAEHQRLFRSDWPRSPCPPYESAYRSDVSASVCIAELAAIYRAAGMDGGGAAPDFLGNLLECAAWLNDPNHCHLAVLRTLLWEDHLACWLDEFAADLRRHARLRLYRDLGEQLSRLPAAG